MINIHARLGKMKVGYQNAASSFMDELLFDVPKTELEEMTAVIKRKKWKELCHLKCP